MYCFIVLIKKKEKEKKLAGHSKTTGVAQFLKKK